MQALVDPEEQMKQYVTAICCFEHSYKVNKPICLHNFVSYMFLIGGVVAFLCTCIHNVCQQFVCRLKFIFLYTPHLLQLPQIAISLDV